MSLRNNFYEKSPRGDSRGDISTREEQNSVSEMMKLVKQLVLEQREQFQELTDKINEIESSFKHDTRTKEEIADWLHLLELDHHIDAFLDNNIDGRKLETLTSNDFEVLGLSFAERRLLLRHGYPRQ